MQGYHLIKTNVSKEANNNCSGFVHRFRINSRSLIWCLFSFVTYFALLTCLKLWYTNFSLRKRGRELDCYIMFIVPHCYSNMTSSKKCSEGYFSEHSLS